MDHSHTCQLQPSEPLPHQQQHQQQLRHHDSSCSLPSQPDHDPNLDATPQDVLAEARKNLQVLIDSGLSRDLLHQWVDDSQSLQLQLSFPLASQPFASPQAQPQVPPPLASQHPPPQPPLSRAPSGSGSASARSTPTVAVSGPPSSASTPTLPSTSIKPEALADDTPQTWPPPRLASNSATASSSPERRTASIKDSDATMFIAPSAPFSHSHSPRISISSVSSGSSGHASIWSSKSAQSSFSWHSGTTGGRSMAPLPVSPSATSMLVVNGNSSASHHNRQNVYWCTSCETSFKRKYDWKRHEDEFHERWRKYPCPEPGCNRSFWGSNSFNQHHKQCHGCKTCPHAEKVVKFLRKRKYWACGFCSALHPARERHVEHVARHFESGMTKGDWMHSRVIYGLLHQPLIHEAWDAMVATKQPEYAGRRPQFSWHPSKTGRTQGFLEKESAGQLQDLLEFFSGDEGEAQWIVTSAYDLADIVLVNSTGLESPPFSASTSTSMAPPQAYPSQDAQASFAAVSAQPPHQPILPSSPNSQCSYTPSFRNTMFVPSQHFTSAPGPSSESSSHSQSPLTASQSPFMAAHSPLALSHSSLEHRELPQLPPTTCGPTSADSIMEFEYFPTPIVFEDWESLSGAMIHEATVPGLQGGWGMVQYFGLPPVTS